MGPFEKWLSAKSYRPTVLNALLLTLLLAMVGSESLFKFVGGATIMIAGLNFLGRSFGRMISPHGGASLYQLALLWAPGIIAIVLSVAAIVLITAGPVGTYSYAVGAILFGVEIAMLIVCGTETGFHRFADSVRA